MHERFQNLDKIFLFKLQCEKVLGEFQIIVLRTPQRIAVALTRELFTSGRRPGRRRHLQDEALTEIIPCEHAFRVTPRRPAAVALAACFELRMAIELIVPYDIVISTIIDLVEGRSERIAGRTPNASE